jgi:hypothetical protein
MYVTVRNWKGGAAFADELVRRKDDVEREIATVTGFKAYYLVRTADGAMSITVCDDQAGTDESTRRAAAYVRENMASLAPNAPEVSAGEVLINLGA